jgi:phospholipase D3/4
MHQKLWIFDARPPYLGPANMDWKSISQAKELGVAVEECPELAADAGKYFEAWWPSALSLRPASKSSIRSCAFTGASRRGRLWLNLSN